MEEVAEPARLGIQPGGIEHILIHDLDRRRCVLQDQRRRRQGFEQAGKLDDERGPGARQLDQLQLGLDGHAERPLRPDEQAGEVEVNLAWATATLGNKLIEVISAHAAEDLGEAAVDLLGVLGGQAPGHAVAGAFQVLLGALGLELRTPSSGFKWTRLPSDRTVFSSST